MSCAEVPCIKSTRKTLRSNRRALTWCGLCLFYASVTPTLLLSPPFSDLVNKAAFKLYTPPLLPTFQTPTGDVCHRTSKPSYARFWAPCVGCRSKRIHVRASSVYQVLTQRERRLIVVWWCKSRLSVAAAGRETSHALVCTRSPLTFE